MRDVLRLLMFHKNINVSQLSRQVGVPQQTLQRLVAGSSSNPQSKTINKLANFFNLSTQQIVGETALPEKFQTMTEKIMRPTVKEIPVLAWNDTENFSGATEKKQQESALWVHANLPSDAFATVINDTSMEPYIPKDATLIISSSKQPKDRSFVLAKLSQNNTIVLRQLLTDADRWYLKPMNPDLSAFPMRLLSKEDRVLGVLIEYRHCY